MILCVRVYVEREGEGKYKERVSGKGERGLCAEREG